MTPHLSFTRLIEQWHRQISTREMYEKKSHIINQYTKRFVIVQVYHGLLIQCISIHVAILSSSQI